MRKLRISSEEFKRRTDAVLDSMRERDLDGFIFGVRSAFLPIRLCIHSD